MTPKNRKPGPENQLDIELGEEIAEGHYSNLAIISHSAAEFIVDFVRILPGLPKARVKSRIIMTPQHAKRLMFALQDNVMKYENNFGEIEIHESDTPGGMNFGTPPGIA